MNHEVSSQEAETMQPSTGTTLLRMCLCVHAHAHTRTHLPHPTYEDQTLSPGRRIRASKAVLLSVLSAWRAGCTCQPCHPFYEAAHQQIPILSLECPEENSWWGGDKCLQDWEAAMELKDRLKDSSAEKSKARCMVQVKKGGGSSWHCFPRKRKGAYGCICVDAHK